MVRMKNVRKELTKPLAHFFLSDEFEEMCSLNGFKTLQDIVENHVSDLLNKPGFTLRILKELIKILERHDLEKYLKD